MPEITPATFWSLYKEQLRVRGSLDCYQLTKRWTPVAKDAAVSACQALGLQTCTEYFRLDVLGYDERPGHKYDWNARIAFEVEDKSNWKDELCKLSHIVSSLCVLVSYEWHANWTATESLQGYLQTLRDRVLRVPGRKWLFIFGPHWKKISDPWVAMTLDEKAELISVDSGAPLRLLDLSGPADLL